MGSVLAMVTGNPRLAQSSHGRGTQANCPHPGSGAAPLTAGVGDGDRHALDLDPVDVDGLHGLGRCCQLCCVQADDAPSGGDLWQGALFPENCGRMLFAGPAQMGSTGCRAATGGGRGGCSCCRGAVLDKDCLHLTGRRTDVDLEGREQKGQRPRTDWASHSSGTFECSVTPPQHHPREKWGSLSVHPSLF